MAIPDYQTLMLPVLQPLSDGQVRRTVPDITDPLAEKFQLTPDDHQRMLLSGSQSIFVNRIHWAVTYLGAWLRSSRGRPRSPIRNRRL